MPRLLEETIRTRPDAVAIVDDDRSLTWSEVGERIDRLVHGLRDRGCSVGDAVALVAQNCVEWMEVWAACEHAGLVFVPLNWHLTAAELAYILDDSSVRAVVTDEEHRTVVADAIALADSTETLVVVGAASGAGYEGYESLLATADGGTPADQSAGELRNYTSGTTGHPKGVQVSDVAAGGDLAVSADVYAANCALLRYPEDGVSLVNAPLYHAGPRLPAIPFFRGGTVILRRRFDATETLRLIDQEQVTSAYLVPTHMVRLLALDDEVRTSFSGRSLQAIWHTGAPCPLPVKQRMLDWFGPVIYEIYGATDAGLATIATPEEWLERPGTVGRATEYVDIVIVDDQGRAVGANEVGTIYVRHTFEGRDISYLNAPEKTEDAHLEPGTVTVGDVGYLDEDGFLFLTDRKIDMIISGGVNIYPAEIEACLITHPAVADVGVFGVPNDEFGEQVHAAVQLRTRTESVDEVVAELRAHCEAGLARYKVPRTFDIHDELPRTPTGKLLKRELRAPFWAGRDRAI